MLTLMLTAALVPSRACGSPEPTAQPVWSLPEFMISVWGEPISEETAQVFEDAHFNTVMANADKLDLCETHGLRAIVRDATPETADALRGRPGVWGLYVKD